MEPKPVESSTEPETYEKPALVPIGRVADLTGGQDSSAVFSDARLKDEVRPVGSALERLRAVETYEAPQATALGRVDELTSLDGSSAMDESDERLKEDLEPIDSALARLREVEAYEPPEATAIGRVEELTGLDGQSTTPSDERLKQGLAPVGSALERLREVETYEAPEATSIGRVDELTTEPGPSTVDGTTTSDERLKEQIEPVGSSLERLRGLETYEAPAATAIGGVDELTAGFDTSSTDASDSDERLKERIEPVESALARLRSIGTR